MKTLLRTVKWNKQFEKLDRIRTIYNLKDKLFK